MTDESVPTRDEVRVSDRVLPGPVADLNSDLDTFLEQLKAISEALDVLVPRARELDSMETVLAPFGEAISTLEASDKKEILGLLEDLERENASESYLPVEFLHQAESRLGERRWIDTLWPSAIKSLRHEFRTGLVLSGLLVSAVSSIEFIYRSVVSYRYVTHPSAPPADQAGAPRAEEEAFTLSELLALGSLEEAKSRAVERRVERALAGSFSDWSAWCQKHLGFDFSQIAIDYPGLVEAVERRHIYVHNRGRASRTYLERLRVNGIPTEAELDDWLGFDEDYLRNLIMQAQVLGSLLAVLAIIKLDNDWADLAVGILTDHIYELLVQGEWKAVESLCDAALRLKLEEETVWITRFNRWIARGHLGFDDLGEASAIDMSAMSDKFKFAQMVLVGDLSSAIDLLPELIRNGQLDHRALVEWPLLAPLRQMTAFRSVLFDLPEPSLPADLRRRLGGAVISPGGSKYHAPTCARAGTGRVSVTPACAAQMGYDPCAACC